MKFIELRLQKVIFGFETKNYYFFKTYVLLFTLFTNFQIISLVGTRNNCPLRKHSGNVYASYCFNTYYSVPTGKIVIKTDADKIFLEI